MVYVIQGDIVLVSRSVLEMLGCIPKHFPRVGEFLEPGDKALSGKLFAINPYPTGWCSDGTFHPELIPNIPPVPHPAREEKTDRGCLKVTPGYLTDRINNPSVLSGHLPGVKNRLCGPTRGAANASHGV